MYVCVCVFDGFKCVFVTIPMIVCLFMFLCLHEIVLGTYMGLNVCMYVCMHV